MLPGVEATYERTSVLRISPVGRPLFLQFIGARLLVYAKRKVPVADALRCGI